jgi:hypothetical protein
LQTFCAAKKRLRSVVKTFRSVASGETNVRAAESKLFITMKKREELSEKKSPRKIDRSDVESFSFRFRGVQATRKESKSELMK